MEAAIPVEETWRLADLFATDRDFRQAKRDLESLLPTLGSRRGRLAESPTLLAEALEAVTDARRSFAALRAYASAKSDEDTRIAANLAMRRGVELLGTALAESVSWLAPEILAIPPERLERFLASEVRLADHAFYLRDLMRQRAHVLGTDEERILSHSSLITEAAASLYNVLNNAELPRPEITLSSGENVRLTPVQFHVHRSSVIREDRLRVFPAYFGAYRSFAETLGLNLFHSVKAHLFRARSRGYPSCLASALDRAAIPTTVYRNLIRQVRERLPVVHDYFRLRAEILGLERLEYPDLYCPLGGGTPRRFTPADARELLRDSLSPLGPSYLDALDRGFEGRWIDWHARPGKRSGAYANGAAYDAHPLVLLNFAGDIDSVSTLAHEMGHALHSFFSNRSRPYATADYPVFVAEVASTFNEALLLRRMMDRASDPAELRSLIGVWLDGFRGTLVRQTLFAEFELEIHERVERGEVLTGESLSETYLALLRAYHGHDSGVVRVDDDYAIEWAAVPHFHFDFYVFQYATGITAATALAETVLSDPDSAAPRYLEFLAAGGSDHPLNLLRRAGVDLESPEPYDAAFGAFRRGLDRLGKLPESR